MNGPRYGYYYNGELTLSFLDPNGTGLTFVVAAKEASLNLTQLTENITGLASGKPEEFDAYGFNIEISFNGLVAKDDTVEAALAALVMNPDNAANGGFHYIYMDSNTGLTISGNTNRFEYRNTKAGGKIGTMTGTIRDTREAGTVMHA